MAEIGRVFLSFDNDSFIMNFIMGASRLNGLVALLLPQQS